MASSTLLIYISLILLTYSTVGECSMFTKNNTRFDWLATESAPHSYPMKIISGTFYYHNEEGGLYVPTAAQIDSGWGKGVSTHVVGEDFKALPDRLDIRFFSYTEDKMYQGSFDLPYDTILAWFKAGVAANRDDPTFKKIMVGVAPGGAVSVWVTGHETREVFFGQAEPYDGILTNSLENVVDDREKFVRLALEDSLTPEMLANIKKNGVPVGKWNNYRKPYRWLPSFVQAQVPKYVSVAFYTGERYKINFPVTDAVAKETRPVPSHIAFAYLIAGEKMPDFYTVRFNEEEVLAAFSKLGDSELITIESDPKLPKTATSVRIYNSKESIVLKKFTIEKY